jgi:hypothetical protein
MKVPYIPKELLHKILEYDGRIKYRNGKYINIIDKNDEKYNIVKPLIRKKIEILKKETITIYGDGIMTFFWFQFTFDGLNDIGLCYCYGSHGTDVFEICYYDSRAEWCSGLEQIITYI